MIFVTFNERRHENLPKFELGLESGVKQRNNRN